MSALRWGPQVYSQWRHFNDRVCARRDLDICFAETRQDLVSHGVLDRTRGMIGDAMDELNYLFQRQQQERVRATAAACKEAKNEHQQLAKLYEKRITELTEGRIDIAAPRRRWA